MLDEGFVEDFSEKMEIAIRAILCAIQNLEESKNEKAENTDQASPQEEYGMSEIRQKLVSCLFQFLYLMIYFCG